MQLRDWLSAEIRESVAVKTSLDRESIEAIVKTVRLVLERLKAGNKVILFGNVGSAADSQHIAAELVVRYRAEREFFSEPNYEKE